MTTLTTRLTIHIEDYVLEELKMKAKQRGQTLGELVRRALGTVKALEETETLSSQLFVSGPAGTNAWELVERR